MQRWETVSARSSVTWSSADQRGSLVAFDTYFPEADSLAAFIQKAHDDGFDIICQCEYGQSRSAACAAAIIEYYEKNGISVFADYRYYPNQLIFNKLLDALKNKEVNI